eukprot:8870198-Pyramimonas_sp.AAC.1
MGQSSAPFTKTSAGLAASASLLARRHGAGAHPPAGGSFARLQGAFESAPLSFQKHRPPPCRRRVVVLRGRRIGN